MATEYVEYNGHYSGEQIDSAIATVGNLKTVATSGSYNDLTNKPTIPEAANDATLTIKKNGTSVGTFTADADTNVDINITVPTTASDVSALPASTKYAGASTAGGAATSANKLNTNAGSSTKPVYFTSGVPTACTYSIEKDVPANAVFTDTTYESKSAASGGTAVSLVTTGEKYTWNGKQNTISDLSTIRSGAALGATAVQPETGKGLSTEDYTTAEKTKLAELENYDDQAAKKNLLNIVGMTQSNNGVNMIYNGDGTYTIKIPSSLSSNVQFELMPDSPVPDNLRYKTLILSGSPTGGGDTTWKLILQNRTSGYSTIASSKSGDSGSFTLGSSITLIRMVFTVYANCPSQTITLSPMIRESTEANTFEPYTPTNHDLYNNITVEDGDSPFATVKSVNHRGYSIVAPENTLPAYKLSKAYGYAYVETDVSYTSDGVAVCLHDDTINRTARNSDGTQISITKYINQITYAEASSYDYGIYKGEKYKGTKIPTIEEFVSLCRKLDLRPYIELKTSGNYTQQSVSDVVDIVKKYGMLDKTTWISFDNTYLGYVKNADSKARLGYILSTISSTGISEALALKTSDNEVFIDCNISNVTDALIGDVITAGLPLEAWTIDRSTQLIAMNPYISGVTSNCLIASKLLRAAEA